MRAHLTTVNVALDSLFSGNHAYFSHWTDFFGRVKYINTDLYLYEITLIIVSFRCYFLSSKLQENIRKLMQFTINSDFTMDNTSEFVINFWDLSQNVRFNFDEAFTQKLFDRCGTNFHELAAELYVSYPFVCQLRRCLYSIPRDIVLKLSDLSKISISEIQRHIISVRTRHGHVCTIQFPISANEKIASLVGHVFGDGYIGRKKMNFEFSNTNPALLAEVKTIIRDVFSLEPMTEQATRIGYSTIVGEFLELFGAPIAPKIYSENQVPSWIMQSKVYSAIFLRSFFDDDGSVMFSENYKAHGLNLYVIRHVDKQNSLYSLLNQVRHMLSELSIYSGNPLIRQYYEKIDGKRVIMYLNVTDYDSLVNYYNFIGSLHNEKLEKLRRIVNKKLYPRKAIHRKINQEIISLLFKKNASTSEISIGVKQSLRITQGKLLYLKRKGLISVVGKVAPNRSYIWTLNGGDVAIEKTN